MKNLFLLTFVISLFILSCKKDKSDPPPAGPSYQIVSGTVSGITNKDATITGNLANVKGKNITSYGHAWSTSHNPTVSVKTKTTFGVTNADTSFTSGMGLLQQGTVYYVRAYATNSEGTFYGSEISFTTVSSFFEFVVCDSYLADNSYQQNRGWVMVYNSQKELVGITEIFNGHTYAFARKGYKAGEKYMVQIFKYINYVSPNHIDYYSMDAYVNIEPDVWYLGVNPDIPQTAIGANVVNITDMDLYAYDYSVTQNLYSWGSINQAGNSIEFPQYVDPDKIWITYNNKDQAPFYKWIDKVALNQSFTLFSSDFTQMTSYADIKLPPNTDSYVYIESEDDLTTDWWEYFEIIYKSTDSLSSVRAYYPDNVFDGYATYLMVRHENILESMYKWRGAIPTQFISMPDNVVVDNYDITNFSASFTGISDVINATWSITDEGSSLSFKYNVYGSALDISSFSAPDLPQELKALDATLMDLTKLDYYSTRFQESNSISNYDDFIFQNYLQPASNSANLEHHYIKTIYSEPLKDKPAYNDREEIELLKRTCNRFNPIMQ